MGFVRALEDLNRRLLVFGLFLLLVSMQFARTLSHSCLILAPVTLLFAVCSFENKVSII